MRTLCALLLLGGWAGGQTTTTISGPISNVKIADCDEKVSLAGHVYTLRELGYCSVILPDCTKTLSATEACINYGPKPEPLDVPAILTMSKLKTVSRECRTGEMTTASACSTTVNIDDGYTCADKTRILEHDEQEPPKYWCHKPQTGVEP